MINIIFMSELHGGHIPSKYRALLRKAKSDSGGDPNELLDAARRLGEPYFISLALIELSNNPELELENAVSAAEEAIKLANQEKRLWRRAELLAELAKKAGSWRDAEGDKYRERFFESIVDNILSMPIGKGLSDAIVGCAPRLGCAHIKPLLIKALSNTGFEISDAKAMLRQWSKQCEKTGMTTDEIMGVLQKLDDLLMRSRLLGYFYLQYSRTHRDKEYYTPLKAAIDSAKSAPVTERLSALRYLASQVRSEKELELIFTGLDSLKEPAEKAGLLATLGGNADKAGARALAINWFKKGHEVVSDVKNTHKRVSIRLNIAAGLNRCGESELAETVYQTALKDCKNDEQLADRISKSMENQGFQISKMDDVSAQDNKLNKNQDQLENIAQDQHGSDSIKGINNILGLYNTYEGSLSPVHLRVIARAAPLCAAYNLDLALMDFPLETLNQLLEAIITESNIGKGGRYLKELVNQERVILVPFSKDRSFQNWSSLGLPVATTSHPGKDKKVDLFEAYNQAKAKQQYQRICLIMGLGKKGLPSFLLELSPYHLELTGHNIPLETCTAMGVIAQQLRALEE